MITFSIIAAMFLLALTLAVGRSKKNEKGLLRKESKPNAEIKVPETGEIYPYGFLRIMRQTTIPPTMYRNIYAALSSPNSVSHLLADVDWQWDEFNRLVFRFKAAGRTSFLLGGYIFDDVENRNDVAYLLESMTVADMKNWLRAKEDKQSKLRLRFDLERHILQSYTFEDFGTTREDVYNEKLQKVTATNRRLMAEILAHTAQGAIYIHRQIDEANRLQKERGMKMKVEAICSDTCPFEMEECAKFNGGDLINYPPFFPGDRTVLSITEADSSS